MKLKISIGQSSGICFFICLLQFFGANKCLYAQGLNLVDIMHLESNHDEVYMNTNSVLADTNFILTGSVSLVESGTQPFTFQSLLSAYNYNGFKLFQKHIKVPTCFGNNSGGYSEIAKQGTNRYLLGGTGKDTSMLQAHKGIYKPYIYVFDHNGDSLNLFVFTDSVHDRLMNGLAVNNGREIIGFGFEGLVTGFVDHTAPWGGEFITDSSRFWIMKLDPAGNLIWHKSYPHLTSQYWSALPTKLVVSNNQTEYLLAGALHYAYPYLLKTDSAGNELWAKPLQLRESYDDHLDYNLSSQLSIDVCQAPDSGYYFVSSSPYTVNDTVNNVVYSNVQLYYGKLGESGDTLWTRIYAPGAIINSYFGRQIRLAANGDLIISGNLVKKNPTYQIFEDLAFVMRTDSVGNVKWYREPQHYNMEANHGFQTSHQLYSLCLTPDHDGILATGSYIGLYDPQHNSNMDDINTYSWVILMDSLGRRCPEDTVADVSYRCESVTFPLAITTPELSGPDVSLYPNPVTDYAIVEVKDMKNYQEKNGLELRIYDMQGILLGNQSILDSEAIIDLQSFAKGMYIVELWNAQQKLKIWKVVHL